jgi:mRNA interferase HigB
MRVISIRTLLRFAANHRDAVLPLQAWRKAVESGTFGGFADLKTCFNSVDRVVAAIHFNRQMLFVRHVFTHRQYDRWKP